MGRPFDFGLEAILDSFFYILRNLLRDLWF